MRAKRRSWGGRTVHRDEARDDSNTKTGQDTTDDERGVVDGELNSDSNAEESTSCDETPLSAEEISNRTGAKSTDERSGRQDRDDKRGRGGREVWRRRKGSKDERVIFSGCPSRRVAGWLPTVLVRTSSGNRLSEVLEPIGHLWMDWLPPK
jgi:hypothetical protein